METEREGVDSTPPVDWADLTHECLVTVFSRLSMDDRWRGTMLVCKSWLRAVKDPSLHSVFNLDSHIDSAIKLTGSRCWNPEFETKIDSMLRSVTDWSAGSLKEIRVRHCTDWSLALVAERCPNLEVLSIRNCRRVTDDSVSRIALSCPKLRELDISYCNQISHESLLLIGRNCPNLKVLRRNFFGLQHPPQLVEFVPGYLQDASHASLQHGDPEAAAIANSMPLLERLEIRFSRLTSQGFNAICQECKKLKFLDLTGCLSLSGLDISNAFSNLKCLEEVKRPALDLPSRRPSWHRLMRIMQDSR